MVDPVQFLEALGRLVVIGEDLGGQFIDICDLLYKLENNFKLTGRIRLVSKLQA